MYAEFYFRLQLTPFPFLQEPLFPIDFAISMKGRMSGNYPSKVLSPHNVGN